MENKEKIKQANITELVGIINKANEVFSYPIFIPSLKREVMFREINTAQQKRLLKSIVDSPIFNTEFIFALKGIIEENCVETDINTDELTIYDKLLIAIKMRIYSMGDDLTVSVKCPKCEKSQDLQINLSTLLSEVEEKLNVKESEIVSDDTNTFKIFCELPTILTEYNLEDEMRKNTKIEVKDENELRETIGNVFISEVVKYISKIEVTNINENKTIELNLKDMKFKDRIRLVEQLNVKLLLKIIEYINNVKKEFDKILLVKTTCNCGNNEKLEQRFSIDSNFFIVS